MSISMFNRSPACTRSNRVLSRVVGINATVNRSSCTAAMVSETPARQIDPLWHEQLSQCTGDLNSKPVVVAIALDCFNPTTVIHMALNHMTAQRVADTQRQLHMHLIVGGEVAEHGVLQCLGNRFKCQLTAFVTDLGRPRNRKAAALDRN